MAERETAYAKINLALHVRSRGADGYHQLETLFAFAESGDELRLEAGTGLSLVATGPFGSALGRPRFLRGIVGPERHHIPSSEESADRIWHRRRLGGRSGGAAAVVPAS
jgi:4-diphosphocytidyl-2-C-methyl-D-erythritol kinase